jgi:hypothetical protein
LNRRKDKAKTYKQAQVNSILMKNIKPFEESEETENCPIDLNR